MIFICVYQIDILLLHHNNKQIEIMGYYNSIEEAKKFLLTNGFEISANVFGEIEYLNKQKEKVTMRKYKDNTCRLW